MSAALEDLTATLAILLAPETCDSPINIGDAAIGRLSHQWRVHAAEHLLAACDRELRAGTTRLTGEDQAIALLHGAARDLRTATEALLAAAHRLRERGDPLGANRARQAAVEAGRASEALAPSQAVDAAS